MLKTLELSKEGLDKGKSVGAIFMYLSKTSDNLNHDLLTAKLEAYGISENSLTTFKFTYAIVYKEQMRIIISVYVKTFCWYSIRICTRPHNV